MAGCARSWAWGAGLGPKGGKGEWREKEKVLHFFKRDQSIEFKFEFEFKQSQAMLQHECNTHQATNLIWKKTNNTLISYTIFSVKN
jgi:hypothetical protein